MEGRTIPPPTSCTVTRSCEASRLQRQLLARAYQQVCPEVRRTLPGAGVGTPVVDGATSCSAAARVAAGA